MNCLTILLLMFVASKKNEAGRGNVRGRFFQEEEIVGNEWNPVEAQSFD